MHNVRIGIDISQLAYEGTGVANYLGNLVAKLLEIDRENEYVLFFSSLRKKAKSAKLKAQSYSEKCKIKTFPFPPTFLDFLWNRLHVAPIEWFIGDVDVFITSDWTEPPTKRAKKATILYDLIVYKYPQETDKRIVDTQRRKLRWAKKECDVIFCISKATKQDAIDILGISEDTLKVVYPEV